MTRARRLVTAALVAALVGVAPTGRVLIAQDRNWSKAYDNALDEIKKQKWAEAIADLTKAITVEPRAQANKHIEGTYYEDYFPYYFRGLAYMQAGNMAKANEDFQNAANTRMPEPLTQDLRKRAGQVQVTLGLQPAPRPPATPPAAEPGKAEPAKPDVALQQAAGFVKNGNTLLAQGRLAAAETAFQQAIKIAPQAPGAQDGLTAVSQRQAKSASALTAGRDLARQHQYAPADVKFQEAVDADASNAAAVDALRRSQTYGTRVADGRAMFSQSNWQGARVQFNDAQSLDADRFKSDGLDATLAEIGRNLAPKPAAPVTAAAAAPVPAAPAARPPLHDALVAYLDGQIPHAIDLLQPLATNDSAYDATGRASLHAYLGVAYAATALTSRTDDDRASWRQKAIKEFQAADAAEPGFQLSQRIVSPAIQAIVNQSRQK